MTKIDRSYRLPGEFEPHESTWLMWPLRPDNWRQNALLAQDAILSLAECIARFQVVKIGVKAGINLPDLPRGVEVYRFDYDDIWVRDTGPHILVSPTGNRLAINWKFNSWGGLFESAAADNKVAERIASIEGFPVIDAPIVLEGGAITCDGAGTIVLTEESVLNDNRNPGLSKKEAEDVFATYLNANQVVWLPKGLVNDEAGGHVDNLCTFASRSEIILASTDDRDNPNFHLLSEAKAILSSIKNKNGNKYKIHTIPLPEEKFISGREARDFAPSTGSIKRTENQPLAASYINIVFCNGAIIFPTFGCEADKEARTYLTRIFFDREILPFYSREFLLGGGAIHCLSREVF